jgi:hypothetical protein
MLPPMRQRLGVLAVPVDGRRRISRFASKSQLFNVTAGAAAILNHRPAFGIRIAPFDLHRPNAGDACDETSEETVAFSFRFDGRHGNNDTPSGSTGLFTLSVDGKTGWLFRYSENKCSKAS